MQLVQTASIEPSEFLDTPILRHFPLPEMDADPSRGFYFHDRFTWLSKTTSTGTGRWVLGAGAGTPTLTLISSPCAMRIDTGSTTLGDQAIVQLGGVVNTSNGFLLPVANTTRKVGLNVRIRPGGISGTTGILVSLNAPTSVSNIYAGGISATNANYVGFHVPFDNNVMAVAKDLQGGALTAYDTGVNIAEATWIKLSLVIFGREKAQFFVNGELAYEITDAATMAKIPDAPGLTPTFALENGGSVRSLLDVNWVFAGQWE